MKYDRVSLEERPRTVLYLAPLGLLPLHDKICDKNEEIF